MPYLQHSMIQEHNDKKKTQKELNYIQKTKNPMRSSNGPQTENGRKKHKISQTSDKTEVIIILS